MLILTIVAIRLIGVWILAAHILAVASLAVAIFNLSQPDMRDEQSIPFIVLAVSGTLPLITGLGLILLSKTLANAIVPARAHDLPAPANISSRTVTQIGIFLIGLWLVGGGLPVVAAMASYENMDISPQHTIATGLGIVLMLTSGLMAGLLGKLRNWP